MRCAKYLYDLEVEYRLVRRGEREVKLEIKNPKKFLACLAFSTNFVYCQQQRVVKT